jgi:hypothetical protein
MQALGSWAPPLTGPTRWEDIMSEPGITLSSSQGIDVMARLRFRR